MEILGSGSLGQCVSVGSSPAPPARATGPRCEPPSTAASSTSRAQENTQNGSCPRTCMPEGKEGIPNARVTVEQAAAKKPKSRE
eukprot:4048617-Amphidinium_carterae.1